MKTRHIFIVFALILVSSFNRINAETTRLMYLEPPSSAQNAEANSYFANNHWAYKTLLSISKKYGLTIDDGVAKLDGNSPITRNEAAVLLVNLSAKIQQNNSKLSEFEKAQLDILKEELSKDVENLTARVNTLEANIEKIQADDKNNAKFLYGEKMQLTTAMIANYGKNFKSGDTSYPDNFKIEVGELGIRGKLNNNLDYRFSTVANRGIGSISKSTTLLGDIYVSTDAIPHHNVLLGMTWLPITQEGVNGPVYYDFIQLSQFARSYSDTRDLGVRVKGDWKYLDYTLGAYNGARNNRPEINSGMDMMTWVNVKPLAGLPQYGALKIGSGFANNKSSVNFKTHSYFAEYNYKKLTLNSEISMLNQSIYSFDVQAKGMYSTLKYKLTDKLELVARYDNLYYSFEGYKINDASEYTFGTNYYFKNRNFMLRTNYVYVRNPIGFENSHRMVIQTQYYM